jgi:hypothetical protein
VRRHRDGRPAFAAQALGVFGQDCCVGFHGRMRTLSRVCNEWGRQSQFQRTKY